MDISDLAQDRSGLYPPTVTPPAGPLPLPLYLLRFVRNPLSALPRQVYEEPLVVYETRAATICWITAPALTETVLLKQRDMFPKAPIERRLFAHTLGDGILTSEGASWRWQRHTAAPLFRQSELLRYLPAMTAAAEDRLQRWWAAPPGSVQPIDIDMSDTTFTVIARTMFSGDALAQGAVIRHAGGQFLERVTWEIAAAMLALPQWVWHPAKRQMRTAAATLRSAVAGMIERRKAEGRLGDDLLGRLMEARSEGSGEPMSERQIVDNLLTFLAAGHETTAKALTWTLYLLACAPDWQRRLVDEVRAVAGEDTIAVEHVGRLVEHQKVLKEAMRLYPPAPVLTRVAAQDVELGGRTLAAGTYIVMPIFAIHRHRRLWDDPDRFEPDRFLPEREATYPRTQYMPFGAGPRICIGAAFAMLEATTILATLVRGARFVPVPGHEPTPVSRVTLRPKGGMPLIVTTR